MPRLVAIDLARFLALIGMMAAHLLVGFNEGGWLELATAGFPSTLFAVLGGFGVVFSTRRYLSDGMIGRAIVGGLTRGAVVLVIGLVLDLLPEHPIAVILVYYGLAIMVASFLVLIPQLPLFVLLIVASVISPLLNFWVAGATEEFASAGTLDDSGPGQFLVTALFTGTYPALTWSIYLGFGIVLARAILNSDTRPRTALTWGGAAAGVWVVAEVVSRMQISRVAEDLATQGYGGVEEITESLHGSSFGTPYFGGWDALLIASPHSGSTADIMRTGGASVVIICILILACSRMTNTPGLLKPVAKVGATPLTSYVLHIAMTAYALAALGEPMYGGDYGRIYSMLSIAFWWQLAVILALGIVLTIIDRRGPLETLVSWTSKSIAAMVPAKTAQATQVAGGTDSLQFDSNGDSA